MMRYFIDYYQNMTWLKWAFSPHTVKYYDPAKPTQPQEILLKSFNPVSLIRMIDGSLFTKSQGFYESAFSKCC